MLHKCVVEVCTAAQLHVDGGSGEGVALLPRGRVTKEHTGPLQGGVPQGDYLPQNGTGKETDLHSTFRGKMGSEASRQIPRRRRRPSMGSPPEEALLF